MAAVLSDDQVFIQSHTKMIMEYTYNILDNFEDGCASVHLTL